MREIIKLFKALSDPNRLRILKMLEVKPLCVCEITEALNLATSTVSKHLSILEDAEFITSEKDGKWVNYTLSPSGKAAALFPEITGWLSEEKIIQSDGKLLTGINRTHICGN